MCLPEVEKSAHVQLRRYPAICHPLRDIHERALLFLVPTARWQDSLKRTTDDAIHQGSAQAGHPDHVQYRTVDQPYISKTRVITVIKLFIL